MAEWMWIEVELGPGVSVLTFVQSGIGAHGRACTVASILLFLLKHRTA